MPSSDSYESLRTYLRTFVNFNGDPVPYDFGGTVGLALALLDNLRANALEAELQNVRETLTDEQAAFLLRLADHARRPDGAA